jgi:hypothetical protein
MIFKSKIWIIAFLLMGCSSLTYVKFDKDGKGDVKTRRGTSYYYNPTFRNGDLPARQKKWRIKRGKKKDGL